MKVRLEFNPRDLWIGAYWKRSEGGGLDVWVCLVPALPLHFSRPRVTCDESLDGRFGRRRFRARLMRDGIETDAETFHAYDAQQAEVAAHRWWGNFSRGCEGYDFEVEEVKDAEVAEEVPV